MKRWSFAGVNSCNTDGTWNEIRTWEVSFRKEKKLSVLSGPWFWSLWVVIETLESGEETAEGHEHNAVILKIKWLPSATLKPEKKFKSKIHGIVYLIPFSGHDTSLNEKKKKIYETFTLICKWHKNLLNWNCLGWDRTRALPLLTCSPFAPQSLTHCLAHTK